MVKRLIRLHEIEGQVERHRKVQERIEALEAGAAQFSTPMQVSLELAQKANRLKSELITLLEDRVLEYVDHLHEHFLDPVVIHKGRYLPPSAPGYSITMKPASREAYRFPTGSAWAGTL